MQSASSELSLNLWKVIVLVFKLSGWAHTIYLYLNILEQPKQERIRVWRDLSPIASIFNRPGVAVAVL